MSTKSRLDIDEFLEGQLTLRLMCTIFADFVLGRVGDVPAKSLGRTRPRSARFRPNLGASRGGRARLALERFFEQCSVSLLRDAWTFDRMLRWAQEVDVSSLFAQAACADRRRVWRQAIDIYRSPCHRTQARRLSSGCVARPFAAQADSTHFVWRLRLVRMVRGLPRLAGGICRR